MTENKDKQNQKQKQQQQKQRQQRNSSGSGSSSSKTNEHLENGIAAAAVNDDDSCEGAVGGSDDRAQQQQQPQQQRQQQQQQQQQLPPLDERPSTSAGCSRIRNCVATNTDFVTNREHDRDKEPHDRSPQNRDEFGTQRVYKKTSPNCVLTLYLPSREITLTGNSPSVLRGIVFVDPKAIQGYRVYTQLTLTFRYGREDEEVMGLRFCNEAIMSLHQIWPRNEEPARESLSPLQEALVKRLGEGAHPFTLSLTSQAPPSVQLVPAKRYYGAPIGTSYDVRCFIVDKTDEKFHRRASVKMGVRVIYRTDVFQQNYMPENFAALLNNQAQSPPGGAGNANAQPANAGAPGGSGGQTADGPSTSSNAAHHNNEPQPSTSSASGSASASGSGHSKSSSRKSERGDSFPKLRLSPKSFRFSGRFGRSKSEIEKCPTDPFHNYSKSFQEPYDGHAMPNGSSGNNNIIAAGSGVSGGSGPNITGGPMPGCSLSSCAGPQAVVDKPFLLQDGRVNLRASLDKAWYTHGEDVNVTVHVRNDSRKTVRKVRVCAIQHVDVCMFNNGKFKNVVADSDTASPADRTVPPGSTLHTIIALRPQRGPTKNWIALEDTLQRSTEPEEITGVIAASAIRSPNLALQIGLQCSSPAVGIPHAGSGGTAASGSQQQQNASGNSSGSGGSAHAHGDDRNVFAIYVSYYVKVKLTLSSMGGEVSLKLPFVLVHIDDGTSGLGSQTLGEVRLERLALHDVPANRKNGSKTARAHNPDGPSTSKAAAAAAAAAAAGTTGAATATNGLNHALLDRIESVDDVEFNIRVPIPANGTGAVARNGSNKRRLLRSETIAKDLDEAEEEVVEVVAGEEIIDVLVNDNAGDDDDADAAAADDDDEAELEGAVGGQSVNSTDIGVGDGDVFMESVHFVQVHTIIEHEYDNVGYGHAPIPAPASAQAQGAIKKKSNNNNNNNNNGNENDSANNESQSHGQREPNV